MKFTIFIILLTTISSFVISGCNSATESKDIVPSFSTPESTIYTYWSYLNKRDYKSALRCFKSHRSEYYDSTLIYPIPYGIDSISIDTILSKKFKNEKICEIYYRVKFYSQRDSCFKYIVTGDRLHWTKIGWLIDEVLIP